MDLRAHQLNCVSALEQIAALCEQQNIPYFLLAGSCLGAVRHQGFIPWDDDIDIGIFNEDYERFESAVSSGLSGGFTWISNDTTLNYPRFYGKVIYQGTGCVDVFRLVPLPASTGDRKKLWKMRKILYKLYCRKFHQQYENESLFDQAASFVMSASVSKKQIVRLARWNETRFLSRQSGDYINLYSIYTLEKETIKREWLQSSSEVLFEGRYYRTVLDTDAYLTHMYGDYMKPPEENMRKLRHIDISFGSE
ncbi:MAG: LicD family protein [Oscillospiraceae bacterium]|nr:LicD family protein [Oscillospiraceae bacterium]